MMKLQTKLAVAFMGSAFFVFMIWDRGTRKTELDVGSLDDHAVDEQHNFESDRIIHRSKREPLGKKLNVIYRQFENLGPCCDVPPLFAPEALDACEQRYYARKGSNRKAKSKRPKGSRRTLFSQLRDMFTLQNTNRASIQRSGKKGGRIVKAGNRKLKIKNGQKGKRETAQKITLDSVSYTDCVFSYSNYLTDNSTLDLALIETEMSDRVEEDWKPIVQDAMYSCEEPAACAFPEMINLDRRYFSIKPTILHCCMRKQMILNCPGNRRGTKTMYTYTHRNIILDHSHKNNMVYCQELFCDEYFKCNSGILSLKSLNTQNLLG